MHTDLNFTPGGEIHPQYPICQYPIVRLSLNNKSLWELMERGKCVLEVPLLSSPVSPRDFWLYRHVVALSLGTVLTFVTTSEPMCHSLSQSIIPLQAKMAKLMPAIS